MICVELSTADLVTYTWAPCTKLGEMRQIERDDGTAVTRLVWDNQNVVQETDDLNVVETECTYQPQPYGHLVSNRASAASSFYKFDDLKSTISQSNSGGTVTDDYRYKAFGPTLYHTGSSASPYEYVGDLGYRKDQDTGDWNVRSRDLTDGRFLSPDPLGEDGGDSNFYVVVGNDPINRQDPSGLGPGVAEPPTKPRPQQPKPQQPKPKPQPPRPKPPGPKLTRPGFFGRAIRAGGRVVGGAAARSAFLPFLILCYLIDPPAANAPERPPEPEEGEEPEAKRKGCKVTCPVKGDCPEDCPPNYSATVPGDCRVVGKPTQRALIEQAARDGCHRPGTDTCEIKHCRKESVEL